MSLIPDLVRTCMHLHNFMMDHGDIGAEEVLEFGADEAEIGAGGGHGGLDDDAEAIRDALAAYIFEL